MLIFFQLKGDVEKGLPKFVNPFSFNGNGTTPIGAIEPEWETFTIMDLLKKDASALIVLPLLALMEHYTGAKMYAGTGRVDASQELISIGLSNIAGSFISSMPITGAFSRTVVNKASGVETPMGGLVTGVLVIVALQFLTPYFYFIPKAALASVICCAVIFTIDLEIIYPMWRSKSKPLLHIAPYYYLYTHFHSGLVILALLYQKSHNLHFSLSFILRNGPSPMVRNICCESACWSGIWSSGRIHA
jgi:sodium-independent sulfate anion transporter 11